MLRRLAFVVCSVGYIGFFPIAPGTAGSAAGVVLYILLRWLGLTYVEAPIIIVLFLLGSMLGGITEEVLGGIDPGPIVIDEVMGMLITMAFIPVNWLGVAIAFVVFRALDVAKPFPAQSLERLPGGLGVMADDAMAAIYGNIVMHGLYWLAPRFVA